MNYVTFEKQELIAFLEASNFVELNAAEVTSILHPYMIKIKEIYIPAAKKLAKRLQTPEAIDLIVDLSELTLALSTITVTPYISVMGALTILYKIKDNPIISEHLPKFRDIMINLEKLEKSLNNFKNAFSKKNTTNYNRKNRRQKMVLDNEEYMAAKEG